MKKKVFSILAVFLFVVFLGAPAQAVSVFSTDGFTGAVSLSGFADGTPETFTATFSGLSGMVNATALADGWYNVYAEGVVAITDTPGTGATQVLDIEDPQLIYSGNLSSTGLTPGTYFFPFGLPIGSNVSFSYSISYDGNASPLVMAGLASLGFPFVNSDGAGTLGVSGTFNADGTSAVIDFTESNLTWTGFGGTLWMLDIASDHVGPITGNGIIDVCFALEDVDVTATVPEPATMLLLGLGLLGVAGARRKMNR